MPRRRKYTVEFKREAVALAAAQSSSIAGRPKACTSLSNAASVVPVQVVVDQEIAGIRVVRRCQDRFFEILPLNLCRAQSQGIVEVSYIFG